MPADYLKVFLDAETWSLYDIVVGPRKYFTSKDTGVHCIAYKVDNDPTRIWIPPMKPPAVFTDPEIVKRCRYYAFNAEFELALFEVFLHGRQGWPRIPDDQWYCVQTDARACGLPNTLDEVGKMLDIKIKKDNIKGRVIKKPGVCKPKGPTKNHPYRFWKKEDKPKWWEQMYEYCIRDVDAEYEIYHLLPRHVTEEEPERTYYLNTIEINRRGLPMDRDSINHIWNRVSRYKEILNEELRYLSHGRVTAATQVEALRLYLNENYALGLDNMQAETIRDKLIEPGLHPTAARMLQIRKDVSATSTAKYWRMSQSISDDDTVKNHLVFYGAGATGRFAAKGAFQSQNMAKPSPPFQRWTEGGKNTERALEASWEWDFGSIDAVYGGFVQLAKDLLRTMIKAPSGKKFLCGDFKAVEARGVAWQCLEEDILEAYRKGLDFYKLIAADMYGVTYDEVNATQRSAGKIAVLACGFQGAVNALLKMAKKMGLHFTEEEALDIVKRFRAARPKLTATWKAFGDAASMAVLNPGKKVVVQNSKRVVFQVRGRYLFMMLPSGRELCYYQPRIERVLPPWGKTKEDKVDAVVVWRKNHDNNKWYRHAISGGNLFQNCIQATCRDLLLEAQDKLDKEGYTILLSIHDECVAMVPDRIEYTLSYFLRRMADGPAWANGFPIGADGWEGYRYHKEED